jgi:hypothetical protein
MSDQSVNEGRSSMVSVRLAPNEQELVRAAATKRGTSVSQFVRAAVLEQCSPRSASLSSYGETSTSVDSGVTLELQGGDRFEPQSSDSMYLRFT